MESPNSNPLSDTQIAQIVNNIVNDHIQKVDNLPQTNDYIETLLSLERYRILLEPIESMSELNLYQDLILSTLLHYFNYVRNQGVSSETVESQTIDIFKNLVDQLGKYDGLFVNVPINEQLFLFNDYTKLKSAIEGSYYSILYSRETKLCNNKDELEAVLDKIELHKEVLIGEKNINDHLNFYQKQILEVIRKGEKLHQNFIEDDTRNNFIEWISSKLNTYASLFEHIPREELSFDYNNARYFFNIKHESIILTSRLKAAQTIEQIDQILKSLEEFKTKCNFDIEHLSNKSLFYHDLLLVTTLKKALDIYNDTSENRSIEQSIELLKKLLDNFQPTKISSSQSQTNEEWDGAINGYHYLRTIVEKEYYKNYYFLKLTEVLSSENPDWSSVKSLSEETENTLKIEIDEEMLHHIISLYKIGESENIEDLEKSLFFIDSCKPILDKYTIDTGLSIYPMLLISAIGHFIHIDIEDISSNNSFSKQLEKYTELFQSLDIELFSTDMRPLFNELKNYGVIVYTNESILDALTEQLKRSEVRVNEEIAYNGEVDLTILSDQINIFRKLIASYYSFSPDIKEIFNDSLKRILIISAGSFEQVVASKHHEALNAVIKVLFDIDVHLQGNPIEDFDNHFAVKVCGHLTHRLYYLREGDNENSISTEHWLMLANEVISAIEKNGKENYRTVINYTGDLYRNLKSIYLLQPPREQYISDDSSLSLIIYQLHQKVSEIINLKSEFAVGALASLEERQKNIPLRALACMVKNDPSHLNNVENILVQLTGEQQLDHMKMVINALMMSSAWSRIISIVENERLIDLKNNKAIIFSYICAKINIRDILADNEIKYYKEEINDLERIFLAEVFINIGDYDKALLQFEKINLGTLDQNSINYTLWLMDHFCHVFIYSRESHNSQLFNEDKIAAIEAMYNKFAEIELPSFDLKSQIQFRLLKLHIYYNNEAKINQIISTLYESKEEFKEYRDAIVNAGQLNGAQKSNLVTLLGTCEHQITLEEAMHAKEVFKELVNAAIENDQIMRDKSNTLITNSELLERQERLLSEALSAPATKIIIANKIIKDLTNAKIEKITESIDSMTNFRNDPGIKIGYRREFTSMRGSQGWSQCEVQKNGEKGKTTVAQVNYETSKLIDDECHRKIMKTALKISLNNQHTIQIASGTWEYLKEIANDDDQLQQHFIRLIPTINAGDFRVLSSRESEIEYWLNYNELALKNLLELRLKSVIEGDKASKSIKVLESRVVDINHKAIFAQTKIIDMSESIINIYNTDKAINHILIPILIPKNALVYHWVGVAVTKTENELSIAYLDSENHKDVALLQTLLTYNLQKLFPNLYVSFKQISVEQQKYNNCGLELIENFVFYLTGVRITQEEAPYVHNELWLQKLIFDQIKLDADFIEVPFFNDAVGQGMKPLLEKQKKGENTLDVSLPSYNYASEDQIDPRWQFKKWLYSREIAIFNQIMEKYNIAKSVDELKDVETSPYSFSIDLENKELESDVIFVAGLKEKLNLPIGTKEIEYLQHFTYKANMGLKVTDTAVDAIRLIYIPITDNAKKALMDVAYVYSMYKGINGISFIPIGYEAVIKYQQVGFYQAVNELLPQLATTFGYMLLPKMISSMGIPYVGFIYSMGLMTYGGYSTIANGYSFYNEFNQNDFKLNSNIAYKNLAEALSTTYLQNFYDFVSKAKEYEKTAYKIKLEEKGEFGQKLYKYIYSRVIEEKYELLNKVSHGILTEEESVSIKAKHVQVLSYNHCMEIIELKEEDQIDHYYCYNEEQQILDHVVIVGEAYVQKIILLAPF
jgi:hypothetical protein